MNVSATVFNTNNLIIIPIEKSGAIDLRNENVPNLTVPDWRRNKFSEAIVSLGYSRDDAESLITDFKCRFAPLYRKIASGINFYRCWQKSHMTTTRKGLKKVL